MRRITKTQAEAWLLKYIAPVLSGLFLAVGWICQEFLPEQPSASLVTLLLWIAVVLAVLALWAFALLILHQTRHTEIPFDPDTHWGAYLDPRFRRSDFGADGKPVPDPKPALVCAKCVAPPDEVIVHLGNWEGGYKCMRCGTVYTKRETN